MKTRSPRSIEFDGFQKYAASVCLIDKSALGKPVTVQTMITCEAKSEEAAVLAAMNQAQEEFPKAITISCRAIRVDSAVEAN